MPDLNRSRPFALIALALTGVAAGAALGAGANAINGGVSPLYFRRIMGWEQLQDVYRASIAQGILEGLLFGLAFALIFTIVVGVVSRARCPYFLAVGYLLAVVVAAAVLWGLGGLVAMGLATLSPEFYQHAFRGVPDDPAEMLRFAWVGGSIWGLEIGGFAAVVVGSVLFFAKWRNLMAAMAPPAP